MKKVFKNRNFFLLYQGSLVSAIGTSLYGFAAGLYIQDLFGYDNGATYLALFTSVGMLVQVLLSPIAGAIIDKASKVKILWITDIIRGFLFLGALYILSLGLPKEELVWYLLGVVIIASLNQAFFSPASTSIIPEIVKPENIQAANGANGTIQSFQTILGVAAGMFLYGLIGFEAAVLINAISFFVSAISEMFIKTNPELLKIHKKELEEKPTFFQDIKFGLKYLWNNKGLFRMMIFFSLINFCFVPVFAIAEPYLMRTEQAASEYQIGITQIIFGVAMFISSIIVGSIKLRSLRGTVKTGVSFMTLIFFALTGSMFLVTYQIISFSFFYIVLIMINIILAYFMTLTNVPINTAMMKVINPEVRGRVFATIQAASMLMMPLSTMLIGPIINETNAAIGSSVFTVLIIFVTLGLITNKKIGQMLDGIDNQAKQENPDFEAI